MKFDFKNYRQVFGDREIVFTHHAIERVRQAGIDEKQAKDMIYAGLEQPLLGNRKNKKYNKDMHKITFWQCSHYLFTLKKQGDKYSGKPIALVLTVTNKLMELSRCKI
jgi:hypothetical protein